MCFPIEFEESSRVRLCKILVGLGTCCVILAKMLAHHGFRYRKNFRLYTSLVEGYDAGALPLLLIVTGLLTSVINLYGIYVAFRSMYPSLRYRMVIHMKIYIKIVSVVVLFLVVCGFFCFLQQSLIDDTFKNGILSALKRYRTEPKIKEDVDRLQLKFMCCGNEKYTDWFQVNWISEEYVDVKLPEEMKQMRNGAYETDDVPFSCCNPDVMRPCVNRNVHDNQKNFNYVYQKDLTLFKDGCRPVLVQEADRLVAFIFCVIGLLLFLELSIAILVRHFITSVKRALELGDPTAKTHGYFFRSCLVVAEEIGKKHANHDSGPSSAAPSTSPSTTVPSVAPPPPPPPQPPMLTTPARPSHPARRLSRRSSLYGDQSGYDYRVGGVSSPLPAPPANQDVALDQTNDFSYVRPYEEHPSPVAMNTVAMNPAATPVPPYAHPTIMLSSYDDPGRPVSRSPSTYDQFGRRMTVVPESGSENPDRRVSRRPSVFDQFGRRMSAVPDSGSENPDRRVSRRPSVYGQFGRRTSTVPVVSSHIWEPESNTGRVPGKDQPQKRESLDQVLFG